MSYNSNYCSIEDAWGSLTDLHTRTEKKRRKKTKEPICNFYNSNTNYDDLEMIRNVNDSDRYTKSRYQKHQQSKREKNKKYVMIDATDPDFVPLYERNQPADTTLDKQFYNAMEGAQCSRTSLRLPDFESHFNPLTDNTINEDEEEQDDYKQFKHLLEKKGIQEDNNENEYSDDDEYNSDVKPRSLLSPSFNETLSPSYAPSSFNINKMDRSNDDPLMEDFVNEKSENSKYLDIILYMISGVILIFVMEQFVKIGLLLQQ